MNLTADEVMYNKNIGIVFFFFGKPSEKRVEICNVIERYFQVVPNKMRVFGHQGSSIKTTRGKVFPDYLLNKIREHDFYNSFTFQLYDFDKTKAHSAGLELSMTDFDGKEFFGVHNPNRLYFEFPSNTAFSDIIDFMKSTFTLIECRCALCNPVISENQYYFPMSYRKAISALKDDPTFFSKDGYFFKFNNDVQYEVLCGVNLIQFYSIEYSTLFNKIDTNELSKFTTYSSSSAYYMFDILNDLESKSLSQFSDHELKVLLERFKRMYKMLKPMSVSFENKKDRYFKSDEWDEWIKRFE